MTPQRQFAAAIGALLLLTGAGVGFYVVVEGWSARQALYMVAISLSTVGFGEVAPLSPAGQWFTIAFVALGFAVAGFAVAGVTAFLVEGDIRSLLKGRRLDRQILGLRDHYVLCGCGAVGREIAVAFARADQAFVVIDINLDSAEMPPGVKVLSVEGDATQEEILEAAGVRHARGLITALHDDPDNVYVTLTARQLNPNLRIIARANEKGAASKLRVAGADSVVSPFEIAGRRMAESILRPSMVEFLDSVVQETGTDLRLEEVSIDPGSELDDRTLRDADVGRRTGCVIMGIQDSSGQPRTQPGFSVNLSTTTLRAGDRLIALGTDAQLRDLCALAGSR